MATKERRSFTKEFKREAVRRTEESDKSVPEVAEEPGITPNQLYRWRRKLQRQDETAFKNETQLTSEQRENKRLRLDIARLREENEILKKAAAYFAKESL